MPGRSCAHLPELTEDERELRRRLREHIEFLASEIGERFTEQSRAAAVAYIERQLRTTSAQVQSLTCPAGVNVVAELSGISAGVLVIGAHYDTVRNSPGANDNASGVAVLLELAKLLSSRPPRCTVRLVAFDNEEHQGQPQEAMGSYHYAAACRARGDKVTGMWSLETLGCYSDSPGSQRYPQPFNLFYPDRGNFVAFVGNDESAAFVRRCVRAFRRLRGFPCEGVAAPERFADIGRSDHWSFWRAGYQALMVTDTANFRYEFYHTPGDTPEKVDCARLARVTRLLAEVIAAEF